MIYLSPDEIREVRKAIGKPYLSDSEIQQMARAFARPALRRAVRLAEQYSGEGMRQNDAHQTRMDIASGISGLDR